MGGLTSQIISCYSHCQLSPRHATRHHVQCNLGLVRSHLSPIHKGEINISPVRGKGLYITSVGVMPSKVSTDIVRYCVVRKWQVTGSELMYSNQIILYFEFLSLLLNMALRCILTAVQSGCGIIHSLPYFLQVLDIGVMPSKMITAAMGLHKESRLLSNWKGNLTI